MRGGVGSDLASTGTIAVIGTPFHYPTQWDGDTDFWCWASEGQCAADTIRCAFRGGHTWPFGSGGVNREKYARLVWDFFRANPLPTAPLAAASMGDSIAVSTEDWSVEAKPPAHVTSPPPQPLRCPESRANIAIPMRSNASSVQ